jgi:hypothetical protein
MKKKEMEKSWLTKDKEAVERIINNSWNASLLFFVFGFGGILIKVILILDGTNLLPEVDIVLSMCWIIFFFLYISARYFSLVYRLIPEETTSEIE